MSLNTIEFDGYKWMTLSNFREKHDIPNATWKERNNDNRKPRLGQDVLQKVQTIRFGAIHQSIKEKIEMDAISHKTILVRIDTFDEDAWRNAVGSKRRKINNNKRKFDEMMENDVTDDDDLILTPTNGPPTKRYVLLICFYIYLL